MDEVLFARLADWLADGRAVVLARVVATHGATPRKRDARMLIDAQRTAFSVGGGAMERCVIDAARALIRDGADHAEVNVELNGRPDSAGVCGGGMRVALRRWQGEAALVRAREIAARLADGKAVELRGEGLGAMPWFSPDPREGGDLASLAPDDGQSLASRFCGDDANGSSRVFLRPNPRLLILGAGHCGQALAELARFVEFDVWVADARAECFADGRCGDATRIGADAASLRAAAADTARDLYIVLLNRDYATDVAALAALHGVRYAFLGMMGSRKRIAQVRKALPELAGWLGELVAPVGIDVGAQTPHEIAVSILAQLIARRARGQGDEGAVVPLSSR